MDLWAPGVLLRPCQMPEAVTRVLLTTGIYVIGGSDGTRRFNDVQFAPINPDGTLGNWSATAPFRDERNNHASEVFHGCLLILGGYNGDSRFKDVQVAPIETVGTLESWYNNPGIPTAVSAHTGVVCDERVYVIGGYDKDGNRLDEVWFCE